MKKQVLYDQQPIDTWSYMKNKLKGKYVPPHYYKYLLDKWCKISQGNKSAKKYLNRWRKISQDNKSDKEYNNEFDEFLNRYNILRK